MNFVALSIAADSAAPQRLLGVALLRQPRYGNFGDGIDRQATPELSVGGWRGFRRL